jgi:hypothetical protein
MNENKIFLGILIEKSIPIPWIPIGSTIWGAIIKIFEPF